MTNSYSMRRMPSYRSLELTARTILDSGLGVFTARELARFSSSDKTSHFFVQPLELFEKLDFLSKEKHSVYFHYYVQNLDGIKTFIEAERACEYFGGEDPHKNLETVKDVVLGSLRKVDMKDNVKAETADRIIEYYRWKFGLDK